MLEYLLSLSLLIVVVLLIRGIFRKTVSPRAIYALWLVVVIRMLLPITLFEVDVTLPEFLKTHQTAPTIPSQSTSPTFPEYPTVITPITPATPITPTVPADTTPVTPNSQETIPNEVITPDETVSEVLEEPASINWKQIIDLVWFCGAVIAAAWVLLTAVTYNRRLKKDRVFHRTVRSTKVYISEYAGVPCIAGLIPSIYITPEAANSKSEILIIIHEHVHLRHGDHIWSIIRALALIVFWWNPLIWVAATVSKQDAELACDDAISSRMNDDGRLKYANILIDTIPQKHRYAVGLGSAPMKERILMLTKKQKNRVICLILAIVLAVSAVGCSFVSLNEKVDDVDPSVSDTTTSSGEQNTPENSEKAVPQEIIDYALKLAKYFRDPVESVSELREHRSLWEFLVNSIYVLHENEIVTLGDATQKEHYPQYYIPYNYMNKVAELLLGIENELPEKLMSEDYHWLKDQDAFLYSPFSPPMFVTECIHSEIDDDGTVHVTIKISRIEEKEALAVNTYTLKPVDDPEFGKLYQLLSITGEKFSPLMKDHSERISLYCTAEESSGSAKHFRINFGEHEAYVTPKIGALISIEHAPKLYCMDIAVPDMPADGIEDAVVILTTGTGTGVHSEEAYVLSGADGKLYSFIEPYTVIENVISHDVNGKMTIVYLSDGKAVSLPDNAYFNQLYMFYIEDGCLYARVNIGYGMLQSLDNYFLIRYGGEGIALDYIHENPNHGKSIDSSLTELLTLSTGDLRQVYGPMTLAWSEAGPGQPVYQLGGKYGVYTVYYATDMNETIPDNRCPDEIIVMKPYSDGDVCGLFIGDDISESTAGIYWSDGWYDVVNGGLHLEAKIDGYILNVGLGVSSEESKLLPNESVATSDEWAAWTEAFVKSPFGRISSIRIRKDASEEIITSQGPFIGYVSDKETPWITLYTSKTGTYVGRIPYEIFHDWVATDRNREGWTPGWQPEYIHFYYAEFGDFRWAAAHLTDTVMGNGRKNVATSADGGQTWDVGSTMDDYGGNHVISIGFLSRNIAYMTFHPDNEPPEYSLPAISRTEDRGKTWQRLDIQVPDSLKGYKMFAYAPERHGDSTYHIPVVMYDENGIRHDTELHSYDMGYTWRWQIELPQDQEILLETKTVSVNDSTKVSVTVPAQWVWNDSSHIFDEKDQLNTVSTVTIKRAVIMKRDIDMAQLKEELTHGGSEYSFDSPITGTTDKGYTYEGFYGDTSEAGRYIFLVNTGSDVYTFEVWTWHGYDGDSFFDDMVMPILNSFEIQQTLPHQEIMENKSVLYNVSAKKEKSVSKEEFDAYEAVQS